jgi:sec-independent protein translocase protein TatA
MGLRLPEVLIILVVLVLVFGAAKIPQLGDALGKGIRNFRKASREDDAIDVTPRPGAQPQSQIGQASATAAPASKAAEKKT